MAGITVKTIEKKEDWEKFLSKHEEANFLHSWDWGEFHKNLGKPTKRSGYYNGDRLIGAMLTVVEPARRGRYLTVPGGPIIDWENKGLVNAIFEEMRDSANENNCVFVRVRPQLIENEFSKKIFSKHGLRRAPMHLHAELTSQLDITKTEDELLANMRKATRYEIRKAIKLGIKIETSQEEKNVKDFYDLQIFTAKRQKFVPFSYQFFLGQFKVFFASNNALLYTATYEKKLLAQAFVVFYGSEAVYHYGASTQEGRHYPGAYLIQWEAIKEAKKRGIKRYNFWGVSSIGDRDHRFSGLSLFKRGFGGEDVQYLHAQDLVINKPKYALNYLIERIRKIVRRV